MRQLYFQQIQASVSDPKRGQSLVALILDHAKKIIAHPARPRKQKIDSFVNQPQADLAIDETLEESLFFDRPEQVLVEYSEDRSFSCVMILDTSSSMTGDKHLLASIAVAVLVLEVPAQDHALVVFSSEAKAIKKLSVKELPQTTLLKFLSHQPRGFTNIASGLKEGVNQLKQQGNRKKIGVIATDGRSTEGENPCEIAKYYDFLVVLHLCGAGSDLEASQQIAQAGNGVCLEVEKLEDLPHRLYEALRMLARR